MRGWRAAGVEVPEEEIQRFLGRIETKVQMLLDSRYEDGRRMTTIEERVGSLEKWQTRAIAWCVGAVTVLSCVLALLVNLYRIVR